MGMTNGETYVKPAAVVPEVTKTEDAAVDTPEVKLAKALGQMQLNYEEQMLENCQLKRRIGELEDLLAQCEQNPLATADKLTGNLETDAALVAEELKSFMKMLYLFDKQYQQLTEGEDPQHYIIDLMNCNSHAISYILRTLGLDNKFNFGSPEDTDIVGPEAVAQLETTTRSVGAQSLAEVILFTVLVAREFKLDLSAGFATMLEDIEYIQASAEESDDPDVGADPESQA